MKAYKLIVEDLSEPWHWNDVIVYAETAGEAKSKGLKEFDNAEKRDIFECNGWREVKYTDIKAIRQKELDKATYGGDLLTKAEIREKEWMKERDAKALELVEKYPDSLAVVWAGCYSSYWGENRSGYASNIEFAGKYPTKEAYDIVRGSDYTRRETVILLDVESYNLDIKKKIDKIRLDAENECGRLAKTLMP